MDGRRNHIALHAQVADGGAVDVGKQTAIVAGDVVAVRYGVALAVERAGILVGIGAHHDVTRERDVGSQIGFEGGLAVIYGLSEGLEVGGRLNLHARLDGLVGIELQQTPATGIAIGSSIGLRIVVVAHLLLRQAVVGAVVAQIALDVQRVLRLVVGHIEAAGTCLEVGERVAHRLVGEDDVVLALVHVAQILAVLLVEERPLVAHLLGCPDEAVGLLVEVAPIDILVAPVDGVVGLSGGHRLRLGRSIARKLGTVADDVELVALLNLVHVRYPGDARDAAHLAHLSIGEGRLPECHFGDVGVHLLAVLVAEQIEGRVNLPARLGGSIVDHLLAVDVDLERAFAVGKHNAIPHFVPDAAHVAAHGTCSDLALRDEEVAVVVVAQVRLEQAVVGIGIGHHHVHHKREGSGCRSTFATVHLQSRGFRHQNGAAACRRTVAGRDARFADCCRRDAFTANHCRA